MKSNNADILQSKIEKKGNVEKIRDEMREKAKLLQTDPYPQYIGDRNEIAKINSKNVTVCGRIMAIRGHGKLMFFDLVDYSSRLQIMLKADILDDEFDLIKKLDVGDIISVSGEMGETQSGQKTLFAHSFKLLTKAVRLLPEKWHGLTDTEERYRSRYVDMLVNDKVKSNLVVRANITKFLRQYLENHDFIEVETPILQPLYGGASARPFKTFYNEMDADFYLRIADELYLKRLIVGGFEKVYEIGKDFRNEGVSRAHNPEFTQLEFYWAYKTYEDLMDFTEILLTKLVEEVFGKTQMLFDGKEYDFALPYPRKKYADLFSEYLQIDLDQSEDDLLNELKSRKLLTGEMAGFGYRDAVDNVYKKHIRPYLAGPMFVYDYPSSMLPLAKPKAENPLLAGSFQLLVAGMEVVKAYDELNDPFVLREKWEKEIELTKKGAQDAQPIDEDFLTALEYGMAPTAGWGMGIDRITALLTDNHHIKEVIAFPTLKPR